MNQAWTTLVSLLLWITSMLFFMVAASLFMLLGLAFEPRRLYPLARLIARTLLLLMGQRVLVTGPPPPPSEGPYIYVFNHSSLLDAILPIAVIPEFVRGVGKKEQFQVPFWGGALKRYGVVALDRGQRDQAIAALTGVEAALAAGDSLLIAPEGTRSPTGALQPFKKGAFHIAKNTGATLLPFAIVGAHRSKSRGSWLLRPGRLELRWGRPIALTSELSVEELRDEAHARLAALLASSAA